MTALHPLILKFDKKAQEGLGGNPLGTGQSEELEDTTLMFSRYPLDQHARKAFRAQRLPAQRFRLFHSCVV